MNSSRPFTRSANKFFRPALDLLNNVGSGQQPQHPRDQNHHSHRPKRKNSTATHHGPQGYNTDRSHGSRNHKGSISSLDDTDHEDRDVEFYAAQMEHHGTTARGSHSGHSGKTSLSGGELPVPLIDIGGGSSLSNGGSRATSPYPRSRSAAQSEDEDDDFEPASSIRPLVSGDVGIGMGGRGRGWGSVWRQGGQPGGVLFGTWMGWQVWVGLLVVWVGGCGFGLLLMNRFILLTGVYKFPFPLTATYLQLLLTHVLLVGFASLTRGLAGPLRRLGFGAAVAPAYPTAPVGGAFRGAPKKPSIAQFGRWLTNGSGGIAGGGLFEFDTKVVKQVLPLAVIFVAKVLLSNISFAYAPLPVYQLARIGVTPLSLLLTCILQNETHSASTLSAALIATLNLLFATLRGHVRVTWESIIAGIFSSLFVALYPILLLRTYRALLAGLVPQGDNIMAWGGGSEAENTSNREETRAYYRTLHYTSLLSLIILTPILLLSGDISSIFRNIPFLDVPFFWLMIWCGALGSFAVFVSTLLLVKATSPLTTTFIAVPRGAVQLVLLSAFKMPAHSWVGVALCWVASLWFMVARREEGRVLERLRLEGR